MSEDIVAVVEDPHPFLESEELSGSPVESFDPQGPRAVRRVKCAWEDRYELADSFLGTGKRGSHVSPAVYPHNDADTNPLYASSVQITPFFEADVQHDPDNSGFQHAVAKYTYAQLEVTYALLHPRLKSGGLLDDATHPDVVTSETLESSVEYITLPIKGLEWHTNGTATPLAMGEAPGLALPSAVWTVTRNFYEAIPLSFFDWGGSTNKLAITSNKFGSFEFEVRTLMYEPGEVIENHTAEFGVPFWRCTMRFHYSKKRWDKFYRSETGAFESIYASIAGTPQRLPYPEQELQKLIYGG